jgi:virginiamycin B lyase
MRQTDLKLAILLFAALGVCAAAGAQTPKRPPTKPGSLSGDVVSAKGAPVAGAQILWQAADGGTPPHFLRTDAHGHFEVERLRPGLYEVRASSGGAWSDWEHNVMVRPGSAVTVKLRLVFKTPPPAAAVNLKGAMRAWDVPVAGALPHDSAVDPKGNIWFTLQQANQIARFNPATQEWKLFKVPTAEAGPHGLVSDAGGNIWFTENYAGKIARLDGSTGAISEYTPQTAKDPHTPVLGPDNAIWFTAQNSNVIGRLDIETRKITELGVPTQDAHPYGIVAATDGALWFCERTGGKLGRVDPETSQITEFIPPVANVEPRRLVAVGEAIYFTDSGGGRLGRFTLADRKFTLWNSPSGPKSVPYGIAADSTGQIWFEESAPAANQLVRFNPGFEIFNTFPMPAPDALVRNMSRDAKGRLWLPLSGANKIVMVE